MKEKSADGSKKRSVDCSERTPNPSPLLVAVMREGRIGMVEKG